MTRLRQELKNWICGVTVFLVSLFLFGMVLLALCFIARRVEHRLERREAYEQVPRLQTTVPREDVPGDHAAAGWPGRTDDLQGVRRGTSGADCEAECDALLAAVGGVTGCGWDVPVPVSEQGTGSDLAVSLTGV